jgi:hypothetical protein
MIPKEILESIECVVPHQCPKKDDSSKTCIYCQINYTFIAHEPILLECQHHVCAECKDLAQNMNCKNCNEQIKATSMKSKMAELFIQSNLIDLFDLLKSKFNESLTAFNSNKKVYFKTSNVTMRGVRL